MRIGRPLKIVVLLLVLAFAAARCVRPMIRGKHRPAGKFPANFSMRMEKLDSRLKIVQIREFGGL